MKIGELDQHCGNCSLIELCGEPYSEICLCSCTTLSNITEEQYIKAVEKLRNMDKRRKYSNKDLLIMICNTDIALN